MEKMKFARKMSFILVIVMLASMLFTGCSTKTNDLGIALITSAAGPNDKGYNQSAVAGLEKVKTELGINYKVVETSDIPGSLSQLAGAGYKLIFSLEYNFDALINGVGGNKPIAEQYPDTTFVIFNDNPNVNEDGSVKHKNVVSVLFDVHEASFIAGALSALVNENASELFNTSDYAFTAGDAGRKVGFLGGTKSNGITVFGYGYAEGINYIAKELGVKYTFYSDYNAGFSDSAAGATKANTYYSDGANIVYAVAGAVGDGVTAKAKEVKKLAIEVDANKDSNQPGYILTSVLKNTEVPVFEISKHFKEQTMDKVNGQVLSYNLASGATGITDLSVIEGKIKPEGKAKWDEIKTQLKAVADKIASGEIKVTNAQAGESFDKSALTNLNMPND
ncbi:BMP family lipoprotein [Ruminiclostridium cellobioparum]|uniref:Putative ABC-type transport system, periplasmic component/surface lipoprotein n=1 Tax=Ruminiclostridium cellobioparum subsp. termitidis CT1112 TaxID=1195236 RepID=S0FJY1_RUMCE|nr:BMP family ABC transporter substrate-binding protein [Ruminiclostridium cellobioparum]EMS72485.1 putative ABC-type transport system, periplasmic component/surface lipoprotein [Ruminiclostridium cellobioparum subsp. termitidis CT1112]